MNRNLHRNFLITLVLLAATTVLAADEPVDEITPAPSEWTDAKKVAIEWIEENRELVNGLSMDLWKFAEPGMLEYKSAELLTNALEKQGFTVERGVAGMPTAFTARYGTDKPVIGILAEYDALGGLSQKPISQADPVVKGAAGHGCGHSLFGAGSVGAAMAVARAIKDGKTKGSVILFGTPNEEGVVGKAYMARDGVFDGIDACLHWHPADENRVSTGESANDLTSFVVAFHGRTAHSAGAPWKGRSALDAIELMGIMANYYREHLHPSYRMHYVIMEGGKAPNIVPDYAKAWFYLRGGTREMVDEMYERMQKIAEAAGMATNTSHNIRLYTSINHVRDNTAGAKLMHANLQLIGPPEFTEQEQVFAKEIQKTMGWEEKGLSSDVEPLKAPKKRDLDYYIGSGSTDVAEVSLIAPTVGLGTATFVRGTPGHHWANVACSGHSIGEKGLMVATKVLAATAVDIMNQPDQLAAMKKEFEQMMDGKKYVSSIPADVNPPILPSPYENPDWEPGELDYPTWSSFVRTDEKKN